MHSLEKIIELCCATPLTILAPTSSILFCWQVANFSSNSRSSLSLDGSLTSTLTTQLDSEEPWHKFEPLIHDAPKHTKLLSYWKLSAKCEHSQTVLALATLSTRSQHPNRKEIEKAGNCRESTPGHLACTASALPLNHVLTFLPLGVQLQKKKKPMSYFHHCTIMYILNRTCTNHKWNKNK